MREKIELKGNLSSIIEVNCLEQIVVCVYKKAIKFRKRFIIHSAWAKFFPSQHAPANLNIAVASKAAIKRPCAMSARLFLSCFVFAARQVDIGRA